jgi:hypothetical protein
VAREVRVVPDVLVALAFTVAAVGLTLIAAGLVLRTWR